MQYFITYPSRIEHHWKWQHFDDSGRSHNKYEVAQMLLGQILYARVAQ